MFTVKGLLMRCYFNLAHANRRIPDLKGFEVADIDLARVGAHWAIEEFRHENEFAEQDFTGWRLDVTDASGALLFTIDLDATER